MPQLDPYLFFDGTCAEAMRFYERTLGGKIEMMMTHADSPTPEQMPPGMKDRIMHARLVFGDRERVLMASDWMIGQPYDKMAGFSLSFNCPTAADGEASVRRDGAGRARQHAAAEDVLGRVVRHAGRQVRHAVDDRLRGAEGLNWASSPEPPMLKKSFIVLLVVAFAFLPFAALQPDTLTVQRSATINAPPEKIYPLITDFHKWAVWSPWEKRDPAMKRTYSGADSGKGAVYAWEGNREVGEGRMEIVDATAAVEDRYQARLHQAARRPQRRRVHADAERRRHRRNVGDDGTDAIHRQGDRHLHGHGQDDRHRFRGRSCCPQGCGREVI